MSTVTGIDEFEDFYESMREITGQSRSDGIGKARRDALRKTADEFQSILTEQIRATETAKGGTLDSRTSPYEPGGENESSGSSLHISNKSAWTSEIVGNEQITVYPKPEVLTRAQWLEYGTDGPEAPDNDEDPMYFYVNGIKVVMASTNIRSSSVLQPQQVNEDGERKYTLSGLNHEEDSIQDLFERVFESGELPDRNKQNDPVEGVEPQRFFRRAVQVADELDIFKKHMGNEIEKQFEEAGLELEGDW